MPEPDDPIDALLRANVPLATVVQRYHDAREGALAALQQELAAAQIERDVLRAQRNDAIAEARAFVQAQRDAATTDVAAQLAAAQAALLDALTAKSQLKVKVHAMTRYHERIIARVRALEAELGRFRAGGDPGPDPNPSPVKPPTAETSNAAAAHVRQDDMPTQIQPSSPQSPPPQPTVRHVETVRGRKRALLHAADCACCHDYFDAVGTLPAPMGLANAGQPVTARERLQQSGRHRHMHAPLPIDDSPAGYWEV